MTASTHPLEATARDTDRLIQLVAELERAQLAEDPEAFLALFDRDAVWVTGGGRRLVGLDEISEFTHAVLPGWRKNGGTAAYVVQHVRFLTPDIAVTSVDQEYLDADGETYSPRQRGLPTYTWRRHGDDWRIVNGQNTAVPDEEGP